MTAPGKPGLPCIRLHQGDIFNARLSIQAVFGRARLAGGKAISPKVAMLAGLIALIVGAEGNRVDLHAKQWP